MRLRWILALCPILFLIGAVSFPQSERQPIIFSQLPDHLGSEKRAFLSGGDTPGDYGDQARIVLLEEGTLRVLTETFHSAMDPEISFDGKRILFSGKRKAGDNWDIFEMNPDGSGVRQITHDTGNCRNPVYLSTFYTLVSGEPWLQIAFTSDAAREINEYGGCVSTSLYSCRLDGTEVQRLTYNPSSDLNPVMLPDGRLLFSSWQRASLNHGVLGRILLFGINTDGTDLALFAGNQGHRFKLMPAITADVAIFVESDFPAWDGSGRLAAVSLRRNFYSHRILTTEEDGLFHSPSALPDGHILVSGRPREGSGTHAIYRLSPRSGEKSLMFDSPSYHDIQAKLLASRKQPDGRSTSTSEDISWGQMYALNVYISDHREEWVSRGSIQRLRVLEGVPSTTLSAVNSRERTPDEPPLTLTRILGEVPVEDDGSFFIEVPANVPIQLQLLDSRGMALRTCGWIWARNRESRGCIGCHEDPELTPQNRLVEAVCKPPIPLTLPPERRRLVDFRRDVLPIIHAKCSTAGCHGEAGTEPRLLPSRDSGRDPSEDVYHRLLGRLEEGRGRDVSDCFVRPGQARNSPLIWHLFGEKTSRPWDQVEGSVPHGVTDQVTDEERRVFVEWVDLGALWDGIPSQGPGDSSGENSSTRFSAERP